jgi:hypothetical protein
MRIDATGKVSGRGAYVCPDPACVDRAVRTGRLAGALDRPVADDLAERLRQAIVRPAASVPGRAKHAPPVVRRVSLAEQRQHGSDVHAGETEGSW